MVTKIDEHKHIGSKKPILNQKNKNFRNQTWLLQEDPIPGKKGTCSFAISVILQTKAMLMIKLKCSLAHCEKN